MKMLLDEFLNYLTVERGLSKNTIAAYKTDLEHFIGRMEAIGIKDVSKIKRQDITSYMLYLKDKGIGSGVHYIPNHIQPLFSKYRTSLPVTEQLYEEILTLPLYYEMTDKDVSAVIKTAV